MEDIKIGDYIRTKQGYMAKFIHVNNTYGFLEFDKTIWKEGYKPKTTISFSDFKKRVTKHSSNIINLIEENDAIKFWYQKERICNVYKTSNGNLCVWNGFEDVPIKHIHIKSIITKEQFENEEYRLEE